MSIATAITNLQGKIANAYTAIENKGGTLPATQNAENLSATIDAIPSGGSDEPIWGVSTLSSVLQTNENGVLNIGGGVEKLIFSGVSSIPDNGLSTIFNNLTSVTFTDLVNPSTKSFIRAFKNKTNLISASFPMLKMESGSPSNNSFESIFEGCSSLETVNMPLSTDVIMGNYTFKNAFKGCTSLTDIPHLLSNVSHDYAGYGQEMFNGCFSGCSSLKEVNFPNLSSVGAGAFQNCFQNCSHLSSVSFPLLKTLGNGEFNTAFKNCSSLVSVYFPNLSSIGTYGMYYGFQNCSSLTSIEFPSLVTVASNAFNSMFTGCTNLTEIHFKAEAESSVSATSGYSTKWGAPNANCQIYFDL